MGGFCELGRFVFRFVFLLGGGWATFWLALLSQVFYGFSRVFYGFSKFSRGFV